MNFEIRAAQNWDEVTSALELRKRVFCEEQGVAAEAEIDGRDADATHVVAVESDGRVMGTCRLLFDGETCKLGRMAVDAGVRRGGIGREIMDVAEALAREHDAAVVLLHAQTRSAGFYGSCGYVAYGDTFEEEGIEHVRMRKELAPGGTGEEDPA